MENAGDYFVALQPEHAVALGEPANASRDEPKRRRGMRVGAVVAVLVAAVVTVGLAVPSKRAVRLQPDNRPIAVPASMGPLALRTDEIAQEHADAMLPILGKIFGSNGSASAQFGSGAIANLLVGRGPIDHADVGDVRFTAHQRHRFGDITCAYMQYKKQIVDLVSVCWYSTATFGASLLASRNTMGEMSEVAAALDAAIPGMRGDAG
jgi:hypothetical protein